MRTLASPMSNRRAEAVQPFIWSWRVFGGSPGSLLPFEVTEFGALARGAGRIARSGASRRPAVVLLAF